RAELHRAGGTGHAAGRRVSDGLPTAGQHRAWQARDVNPQTVPSVTVAEVADELPGTTTLLDVREDDEWAAGHAPNAVHIPLGELAARLGELPEDNAVFVVCRA